MPHNFKEDAKKMHDETKLHNAGATVQNDSGFRALATLKNNYQLDQDFIDKWVTPFYLNIGSDDDEWIKQLRNIELEISKDVIFQLLVDFNWRSRSMGAFFAGIKGFKDFADIIGTHLLKSELAYAGKTYALALASFNSENATEYLRKYLDYYLLEKDLWFDQREVLEALTYLDKINNTKRASEYTKNWAEFIDNKPYWKKEIDTIQLENQLQLLKSISSNS